MAAPTIPPIRPGLIGTGLAVEKLHRPALCAFSDRSGEQSRRFADHSGAGPARATAERAASPARDDVAAVLISVPVPRWYDVARDALTAGEGVLRESSDAATHTTVIRGNDNGHRAEIVDVADAVRFGVRPVGSVARSVADVMVVQRALDPAHRAAVPALDPVPGAGPVPPRRPRGSTGPFGGLPSQRISSSASFAA